MSTPANPCDGPPLWSGLSVEDVSELLRTDVCELRRLHARKAADDLLPPWQRNPLLATEISAREKAHDQHFAWLKDIEARESRPAGEQTL